VATDHHLNEKCRGERVINHCQGVVGGGKVWRAEYKQMTESQGSFKGMNKARATPETEEEAALMLSGFREKTRVSSVLRGLRNRGNV
jgi:hypothetical protein